MAQLNGRTGRYVAPKTAAELPNIKSNAPFRYMYHPLQWCVKDGRWFPMLAKQFIDPGVGGVDKNKGTMRADHSAQKHGFVVLDLDPDKFADANFDYIKEIPVKSGTFYAEKWEQYHMIGGQVLQKEPDHKGYAQFIECLQMHGLIPEAPEAAVQELLHAKQLKRVQELEARASTTTNSAVHHKHARAVKELEALEILMGLRPAPQPAKKAAA